jgi:hypothetical protein
MKRHLFGLMLWLLLCGRALAADAVETAHLSVHDATGSLGWERLVALAEREEAGLAAVRGLWGLEGEEARAGGRGKIRVVYDQPQRGQCTSTFFLGLGGQRTLRVFGCPEAPLMLAHKMTSALMPQPDKLIRNMLGEISEQRLGRAASFPACGQDADDWVRAFEASGLRIPLADLGPDHGSWGMRDEGGGRLIALDRLRQLRAYAEAGSFARYLAREHGLEGLKRLQWRTLESDQRPWAEVFGADLPELERRWLESLKGGDVDAARVERLARILMGVGGDPCERARKVAGATQ